LDELHAFDWGGLAAGRGAQSALRATSHHRPPVASPVFGWAGSTPGPGLELVAAEPAARRPRRWVTNCPQPAKSLPCRAGDRPYRYSSPNRLVWADDVPPGVAVNGWLVDQTPYPGWRAYVGQERVPLCPANVVQTLVVHPGSGAGPAFGRLVFDPLTIRLGGFLGLLSLAAGAMVLCAGGRACHE